MTWCSQISKFNDEIFKKLYKGTINISSKFIDKEMFTLAISSLEMSNCTISNEDSTSALKTKFEKSLLTSNDLNVHLSENDFIQYILVDFESI